MFTDVAVSLSENFSKSLTDWIREHDHPDFPWESASSVAGGCIHDSWKIDGGGRCYFLKRNNRSFAEAFYCEDYALKKIRETQTVRVPKTIGTGIIDDQAFLLMEWLEMRSPTATTQEVMGKQLAQLHRQTSEKFGWEHDNFVGRLPQKNQWQDHWCDFWIQNRLQPQWQWAQEKGLKLEALDSFIPVVNEILKDHHPHPSLLHGDLWGGNMAATTDQTPVIFDPASYYGDRETDLAFSEMFGGFSSGFYKAYEKEFPLAPGYPTRKELYNLYHLLNHYNHFGGAYGSEAVGAVKSLSG
jgi:fructosamine-3-kinase